MISLGTALGLARAETRRARGTLAFCVLAVSLGVLAITAVRSLSEGLRQSIEGQAQQLLGADLVISGNQPLESGAAAQLTRELLEQGARGASSTRFYSMLARTEARAGAQATHVVRVRAIETSFPFYGRIDTSPPAQFARLGEQPSVLVDAAVARALALRAGDRVKLGELEATVLGQFDKTPGSPAAEFSMAPYIYLDARFVAATGLLERGSRVRYERLFALPEGRSAESWKEEHWNQAIDAHLTIRTSREAAGNVRRFLSRLSGFMTVAGLVTLFLGALGIGSAMHAFMSSKLDHAAVLRCLGATSKDLFLIFSLLSLGMGLAGSVLGAGIGTMIPPLLARASRAIASGYLPAELVLEPSANAVLHGLGAGLLSTFAFTLVPIWRTSAVAPLRVLKRAGDALHPLGAARWAGLLGPSAALLSVFILSLVETGSLRIGVAFTLASAGALAVLFALSKLIAAVARRLGSRLRSFHLRQGIANLHRPGNQTSAVIVAVGMGFVLLGTLLILQRSLSDLLAFEQRDDLPNLFVIDIQPDQREAVESLLRGAGARELDLSPMISARIGGVNGKAIERRHVERDDVQRTWQDRMRTREYFISYRSELLESEAVTAGRFWQSQPERTEASLEEGLAENLGIELGDTLTLDIQGLPFQAQVTSLREIRWQSLRPNSMILLSPGAIEAAPTTFVASARVSGAETRQALQADLVERGSNLTVIDASEAAQTVLLILGRISSVFSVLGALSVLAGAVILAGAIAAGRFARQREAMLFKVLGASRADLRRILGAEYITLALLGTACGWLLAEIIGRLTVPTLFDAAASVPYPALAALALSAIALNTLVAVLVGRRVSQHTPLSVLREE